MPPPCQKSHALCELFREEVEVKQSSRNNFSSSLKAPWMASQDTFAQGLFCADLPDWLEWFSKEPTKRIEGWAYGESVRMDRYLSHRAKMRWKNTGRDVKKFVQITPQTGYQSACLCQWPRTLVSSGMWPNSFIPKAVTAILFQHPLSPIPHSYCCHVDIAATVKRFTFFFFFWPCHSQWGILAAHPGMTPCPLRWKHSLNHWATREVSKVTCICLWRASLVA